MRAAWDTEQEGRAMLVALERVTVRKAFIGARRIQSTRFKRTPNWEFAMELFGLGSTYAWNLCVNLNIDPDSTAAETAARRQTREGAE